MGSPASGPKCWPGASQEQQACLVQSPAPRRAPSTPTALRVPVPTFLIAPELLAEPASLLRVPRGPGPRGTGWPHQWTESRQRQRVVGTKQSQAGGLFILVEPLSLDLGCVVAHSSSSLAEGASPQLPPQACAAGGERPSSTQESSLRFTF